MLFHSTKKVTVSMNLQDFRQLLELQLIDQDKTRMEAEKTYFSFLKEDYSRIVAMHTENLFTPGSVRLKSLSLIHLSYLYRNFSKGKGLVLSNEINEL